jgi:Endomembrane protein 70
LEYKTEGLGEVLEGDRLVNTPYNIPFRVDKYDEVLCSRSLNADDLQKLRNAAAEDYYFQVWPRSKHPPATRARPPSLPGNH